jgi:tripartite ATP-independent transporter DctP family solute receptor
MSFFFAFSSEAAPSRILKLGHAVAEENAYHFGAIRFKDLVESRTGGDIQIDVFPNNQLGTGERDIIEGLQLGTIDLYVGSTGPMGGFEKKFLLFDFPFLFKTEEAAFKALDGEIGATIRDLLLNKGIRVLGYGSNGYRHITNNRGPIRKPDDLKGLKVRVLENPIFVDMFKKMGASPTPMAFSELYTALQQKTVDAQENPMVITYTSKLYEVQKYISKTGHVMAVVPLIMSENFYQDLPPEYQQVMIDAGKFWTEFQRKGIKEREDSFEEAMKKDGVEINELTSEEKDVFVEGCKEIYTQYGDSVGLDLIEKALQAND